MLQHSTEKMCATCNTVQSTLVYIPRGCFSIKRNISEIRNIRKGGSGGNAQTLWVAFLEVIFKSHPQTWRGGCSPIKAEYNWELEYKKRELTVLAVVVTVETTVLSDLVNPPPPSQKQCSRSREWLLLVELGQFFSSVWIYINLQLFAGIKTNPLCEPSHLESHPLPNRWIPNNPPFQTQYGKN